MRIMLLTPQTMFWVINVFSFAMDKYSLKFFLAIFCLFIFTLWFYRMEEKRNCIFCCSKMEASNVVLKLRTIYNFALLDYSSINFI